MDSELAALEAKVRQAAELCQHLRAENRALRQQLAAAESERHQLAGKVESARARLERLLERMPE